MQSNYRTKLAFGVVLAAVLLHHVAATVVADVPGAGATIVVAAKDSSERSRTHADVTSDGEGDQQEINAAIRALPPVGGTVMLMEGTFDIRKVEGTLGGVLIERSNVALTGQGAATKLILAPNQNTNVIRIIGSDVSHVTIRDLYVDANRAQNSDGQGDPNISHDRFEFCGIKAFCRAPGGPAAEPNHDIIVRDCYVLNAQRLGVMLEGANMRVLNNVLGNAGSDSVEILTGPGTIRGNYVEITGQTHVAIGTDRADSIIMANNIVHVKDGGNLDIGFRSWAKSRRHVIAGNVLVVEPGGNCTLAMDVRGTGAAVTGNSINASDQEQKMRLKITGGLTAVTGNLLENVDIEVVDETGEGRPVAIENNVMENVEVVR